MGTRRSANLDRLLDRLLAGEEPEATGDLAPHLHPARVARAALARSVDPVVARSHLAALRDDRARNIVVAPAARRRGIRVAAVALVGAIILTLGAGTAVAASSEALPGDALYGLKRALERVSLAMHRDPVGRSALCLQFASTRLHEVQALIAAGENAGGTVDDLKEELDCAESEASEAVALGKDAAALLTHVQEMISKHISVLNTVLDKAPNDAAKAAIERALENAKKAQENVQRGRDNENRGGTKPTTPPGKSGNAPGRN